MIVRRGLPVLSLALIFLGLELSTGALSDSGDMIRRVLASVAAGRPTSVFLPGFFAGLLAIAGGLAGLGASLWSRLLRGRLTFGRGCPRCGAGTKRIRRHRWQRFLGRLLGEDVQRRFCKECGWKGLCRIPG